MKAAVLLTGLLLIMSSAIASEVSAPSKIPLLSNYHTPEIRPGATGEFKFTIENRYNDSMENVTVTVEIYRYLTVELSKGIKEIAHAPIIRESSGYNQTYERFWQTISNISPNNIVFVNFTITTHHNTPQGTYLVRNRLEFEYNNTSYLMLSRGYFSDDDWEYAEATGSAYEGKLNLTHLNCSGIIPDSAFSVKEPIPSWPLYLLISITVFFLILAVIFYFGPRKCLEKLRVREKN